MGAGAKYLLDTFGRNESVYLTYIGSKVFPPPTSLPPEFPPMTAESLEVLRTRGRAAFADVYGTHFVFEMRTGGFLSFTYEYQANRFTSKSSIKAMLDSLSIDYMSGAYEIDDMNNNMRQFGVNVVPHAQTNTQIPYYSPFCTQMISFGTFTSAQSAADCLLDWSSYSWPISPYGAFAMPFEYHPQYRANLPPWDTDTGSGLADATSDSRFAAAGLLRVRLNRIASTLNAYQFKEDNLYLQGQQAVEGALGKVQELLDGLRLRELQSTADWQRLYRQALGLINVASQRTIYRPRGGICGYCLRQNLDDDRSGGCSTSCSGTLDCAVVSAFKAAECSLCCC
ncbi:MAG: hypothetical protein J3K34DRAFT_65505 [Monoraphidium minutum]|nr:MAG: hypothetical protein J3K34DRAFT_65505 [Monoraphidium minutum]